MKVFLGISLAWCIGALARIAGIPVPAPPAIAGALLVFAMTLGFVAADKYATRRKKTRRLGE